MGRRSPGELLLSAQGDPQFNEEEGLKIVPFDENGETNEEAAIRNALRPVAPLAEETSGGLVLRVDLKTGPRPSGLGVLPDMVQERG